MPSPIHHKIVRETLDKDYVDNLPIIIELHPSTKCFTLRLKGGKDRFSCRYADVFRSYYQARARELLAERHARKGTTSAPRRH